MCVCAEPEKILHKNPAKWTCEYKPPGVKLRVDCIKRIRPFFILCAEELVPKGFLDPNFSGIWLKYGNFDEKVTWTFSKIDF